MRNSLIHSFFAPTNPDSQLLKRLPEDDSTPIAPKKKAPGGAKKTASAKTAKSAGDSEATTPGE
jgi:hypothetical protein